MRPQNGNTLKSNTILSTFNNSRRDFIKLCSTATVGGFSSLLLPQISETKDSLESLKMIASQDETNELFWSFVRLQFVLQPGLIYMNTGTEGSMPRCMLSRLSEYFREFTKNPWDATVESDLFRNSMIETRTKVAEFLGANIDEIVLTTNTTEGMSFTANGLDLQEGDEVLTTLHEHDGGLCCWYILKDRRNVTVTPLELPSPPESEDEIIALFEDAITPQTKVMSFCHINWTTGLRMPVKELCQLARDHGIISVVDGAHAIGMLNFDLHELGCDFYACSPHKWLNAPPGTGVLYMREDAQDLLWPTVTEGYSVIKRGALALQVRGQQCTPVYACMNDAIDFQNAIGKDKIEIRILALNTYLKNKIIENWGEEKIFTPTDEELSSGLVSFNPSEDPFDEERKLSEISQRLRDDYGIIIRTVWFKDKHSDTKYTRALRVSTHIFNNKSEIERLNSALQSIIATI